MTLTIVPAPLSLYSLRLRYSNFVTHVAIAARNPTIHLYIDFVFLQWSLSGEKRSFYDESKSHISVIIMITIMNVVRNYKKSWYATLVTLYSLLVKKLME